MIKYFIFLLCFISELSISQDLSFAFFTDLHISKDNPVASEDLRNAVVSVNKNDEISFILVGGDITESGDYASLYEAKSILDNLSKPYYITSGNHETKWSNSGYTDFVKVFGDDKFSFELNGYYFLGFGTGPIIKMGDGHILPQDIRWISSELNDIGNSKPVFIVTHYPLLPGDVDNWYEMTDVLRDYNVQAVLGGHYHSNKISDYDGICGIISRSTLRGKERTGGFNIFQLSDSLRIFTQITDTLPVLWKTLSLDKKDFKEPDQSLRPDYSVNSDNKRIIIKWENSIDAAIFTTAAVDEKNVYFGDDLGYMNCLKNKNGKSVWKFKTMSRIISSPAVTKGRVVFGSTDGNIYCLSANSGSLLWKYKTEAAVMGCPLILKDTVFIGGSDGSFRAFDLISGQLIWEFKGILEYIETKPVASDGIIIFGAWDTYLYALNTKDGTLVWKWNNGSSRMHFSPAAVHPVVADNKVFITAPDRFMTALNVQTGREIWRTKEHQVRETIGISKDGTKVFSRYMNDFVFAVDTKVDYHKILWKTNAGFGYDHNPGMLIDNNGVIIFGTKNGILCGIDSEVGTLLWKYKIGNSIINTITPVSANEFILTTTGGIIARLEY